jgi:hypothetical protein
LIMEGEAGAAGLSEDSEIFVAKKKGLSKD